MKKEYLAPKEGPKPSAPFSQGIKVSGQSLIFISGQVSKDQGGNIVGKGDIRAQTKQVMENIGKVLRAGNASYNDVVKIVVYLTNMSYLPDVIEVRNEYLKDALPTSTAVEVSKLANPNYLVEIEAIAATQE